MNMSKRTFGVELEMVGLDNAVIGWLLRRNGFTVKNDYSYEVHRFNMHKDWRISDDGSLSGAHALEVKSPILKGAKGLKALRKVVSILADAGALTNRYCGLHVHVGAKDFNVDDCFGLVERYGQHEEEIDQFVTPARRKNKAEYARSVSNFTENNRTVVARDLTWYKANYPNDWRRWFTGKIYNPNVSSGKALSRLKDFQGRDGFIRYSKINLNAIDKFKTIEFRHHHGSLDAQEISDWVHFCMNFMETSKVLTPRGSGANRKPTRSRDNGPLMCLDTTVKKRLQARKFQ